jgi:hypothetical protein
MFSYFKQLFSIITSYEQYYTDDTIIHIDPESMTVDIETGHLILLTHLEENDDNKDYYYVKKSKKE